MQIGKGVSGLSDIKKRALVTVFWIVLVGSFVYFKSIFTLIITLLSVFSVKEFYDMVEKKGIYPFYYLGLGVAGFIPLSVYFGFELNRTWQLFLVIMALFLLFILQLRRTENEGATAGIAVTIFGIFYIAWTLTFLLRLRLLQDGIWLFLYAVVVTKSADIGAYLIGKSLGKRPFTPRVSPNKTWEGFIAGVLFAVASSLICVNFISYLSLFDALLLGALTGILGQIGDVSESLIKRDCGIKDSGKVFPGMGGFLDTLDSLLFSSPVIYFYVTRLVQMPK